MGLMGFLVNNIYMGYMYIFKLSKGKKTAKNCICYLCSVGFIHSQRYARA